jgi:hypothetical protein
MRTGDLDICGNCRHWVRGSNQPRNAASFGPDGGECRKMPPRGGRFDVYQEAKGEGENLNTVSVVNFPFPPTHQLDWCSEWDAPFPQETTDAQ